MAKTKLRQKLDGQKWTFFYFKTKFKCCSICMGTIFEKEIKSFVAPELFHMVASAI
jgi:hypothetical protein